jgi:hypothetical protein
MFALFGVISFSLFRVLAFRFHVNKSVYSFLLLMNGVLSFLQAILQTCFILSANRKRTHLDKNARSKHNKKGREHVTFLIMANIALWLIYSVTRSKYASILFKINATNFDLQNANDQIHSSFNFETIENAQSIKWIIINTISYPLLLYFHFHSSCCLSNIWKNCYTHRTLLDNI